MPLALGAPITCRMCFMEANQYKKIVVSNYMLGSTKELAKQESNLVKNLKRLNQIISQNLKAKLHCLFKIHSRFLLLLIKRPLLVRCNKCIISTFIRCKKCGE